MVKVDFYSLINGLHVGVKKELRAKGYDVQLIVPETHDVSLTERARRVNEI